LVRIGLRGHLYNPGMDSFLGLGEDKCNMKLKDLLSKSETAKQVVLGLARAPQGESSFPVKIDKGVVKVKIRELKRK